VIGDPALDAAVQRLDLRLPQKGVAQQAGNEDQTGFRAGLIGVSFGFPRSSAL